MSSPVPPCRTVTVFAFRGDRSRAFATAVQNALDDDKNGRGPAPPLIDCLLYAGHAGVSADGGSTIFGFHPDGAGVQVWQMMDALKKGEASRGLVRDDTGVFAAAKKRGMLLLSFDVILPDQQFQAFKSRLDAERLKSQYSYGFPNGDGDCNCITWLERLGLPLLTGRMNDFANLSSTASRRFGLCV